MFFKPLRAGPGFAFDSWYLPKEIVMPVFSRVARYGIRTIAAHSVRQPILGAGRSLSELIDGYGLLGSRFLLSHSNMSARNIELNRVEDYSIDGINSNIDSSIR